MGSSHMTGGYTWRSGTYTRGEMYYSFNMVLTKLTIHVSIVSVVNSCFIYGMKIVIISVYCNQVLAYV